MSKVEVRCGNEYRDGWKCNKLLFKCNKPPQKVFIRGPGDEALTVTSTQILEEFKCARCKGINEVLF